MMRDVFLLRGHDKDISTLVWHPIHSSMLSTGGSDGAMHHYLLDEQNLPEGTASSLSPYDAPENSDAPAQTIYPAHRVTFAHDFAIWSMDWHPLGHILASGSNDRATRFWSRPRPGDGSYKNDRWHIGQSAAEAEGTWKRTAERGAREEDEEAEDEADGLVDQQYPARQAILPGLPGISASMPPFPDGTSTGGAQPMHLPGPDMPPIPLPNLPFALPQNGVAAPVLPPGMTLDKLKEMFGDQFPPVLPVPGNGGQNYPPPPIPGYPGAPPLPLGMLPPGFPPSGYPVPPPGGLPGMPPQQSRQGGGGRRAPLPSQQESLQQEMKRGNYARAK